MEPRLDSGTVPQIEPRLDSRAVTQMEPRLDSRARVSDDILLEEENERDWQKLKEMYPEIAKKSSWSRWSAYATVWSTRAA